MKYSRDISILLTSDEKNNLNWIETMIEEILNVNKKMGTITGYTLGSFGTKKEEN